MPLLGLVCSFFICIYCWKGVNLTSLLFVEQGRAARPKALNGIEISTECNDNTVSKSNIGAQSYFCDDEVCPSIRLKRQGNALKLTKLAAIKYYFKPLKLFSPNSRNGL